MTAQPNPYVKVYYSIVDDPKFATIYDDDAALSAWLRLLLVADGTYPAPAPLPHGTKPRIVERLSDAGLIDLLPGHRYRVHGLASEREKRSDAARTAAAMRWHSDRNADALPAHSAPNASPLRSTPSNSAPPQRAREADPVETYHLLTGRPPKKQTIGWLDEMSADHGPGDVSKVMAEVWMAKADLSSFLGDVQAELVVRARRESQAAEDRRARADAEYERRERERIANPSPEEAARAEEAKAKVAAFVRGF